jgi:hypothetical protein
MVVRAAMPAMNGSLSLQALGLGMMVVMMMVTMVLASLDATALHQAAATCEITARACARGMTSGSNGSASHHHVW